MGTRNSPVLRIHAKATDRRVFCKHPAGFVSLSPFANTAVPSLSAMWNFAAALKGKLQQRSVEPDFDSAIEGGGVGPPPTPPTARGGLQLLAAATEEAEMALHPQLSPHLLLPLCGLLQRLPLLQQVPLLWNRH